MRYSRVATACLGAAGLVLASAPLAAGTERPEWPRYDLSIEIDPPNRILRVDGSLQVPGRLVTGSAIDVSLTELAVSPSIEVLSPVASAGIGSARGPMRDPRVSSRLRPYSRPGWGTNTWTISSPAIIPGQEAELRFSYAIHADRSSFLFAVAPDVAFGAGLATAWYPQIEEPTTETDGRLRGMRGIGRTVFEVPAGFEVQASGTGPVRQAARYGFEASRPVHFSFVAGRYTRQSRGTTTPISLLALRDRPEAAQYLEGLERVMAVLSEEFGDFAFGQFSIAEVPVGVAESAGFGGASLDGFILATNEFLDQPFNTAYFGHEMAHQWWGGLVRRKGGGRWLLDEAMAQYGSLVAVGRLEGESAAESYRRRGYPGFFSHEIPYGADGYLMLVAAGVDLPLGDLPPEGSVPRLLADSKGMLVWDMLAEHIGRPRFRQVLRRLTERFAYQRVEWSTFLDALASESGADLDWFWRQWLDRAGLPHLSATWARSHSGTEVTVAQTEPTFRLTVPLSIVTDRGTSEHLVELRGPQARLEIPGADVREVLVDPRFTVLHATDELLAEAQALAPYTRAYVAWGAGEEEEALRLVRASRAAPGPADDSRGLAFMLAYLEGRILAGRQRWQEAIDSFQQALSSPTPRPEVLPWLYLDLATAAAELKQARLLEEALAGVERTADGASGGQAALALARALARKHGSP